MKVSSAVIDLYTIKEVHAYAGELTPLEGFYVYTGKEVTVQDKMYHPSRSEHFSIHLVMEDAVTMRYNLIDYTLPKHSLFIIHPGVVHALKEATQLPAYSIGFTHEFFGAALVHKKHAESTGFMSVNASPLYILTAEEAQTVCLMMQYLKKVGATTGHPYRSDMIHHGFNLLMLEVAALSKKYRVQKEQGISRKEDILLTFLKQLSEHFKEERSVQFYAAQLFITPKHLTKTVKELTNQTCGDFIDEMVITEAKILLGELSYSVAQVADHLHFSDQFFFSKFFKKRTGLSPKAYKSSI